MHFIRLFIDNLKTPEGIWNLIIIIIIILLATAIKYSINQILKRLLSKEDGEPWKIEQTQSVFLNRLLTGFIYFIAFIIILFYIPPFRSLALSISFSTSIVAAFVLFASQQTLANVISGLFIVFSKPFKVGDYVAVDKIKGFIEDVTLRHVVIIDKEQNRIIIPNSYFSTNMVKNFTFTENAIDTHINISLHYLIPIEDGIQLISNAFSNCFQDEPVPRINFYKVADKWIIYKIRLHIQHAKKTDAQISKFIQKLLEQSETLREEEIEGVMVQIEREDL